MLAQEAHAPLLGKFCSYAEADLIVVLILICGLGAFLGISFLGIAGFLRLFLGLAVF
jgi:hypothetical protein